MVALAAPGHRQLFGCCDYYSSELHIGESEPHVERSGDGIERLQRDRVLDLYDRRAGDMAGISPSSVTPTAGGTQVTVVVGNATPGTFNFTIQGTDGTLTHATPDETLTVDERIRGGESGTAALFASEAGNSWPAVVTQQQFTATVNGSTNQNVTWAVTGGSANGTWTGRGPQHGFSGGAESGDSDGDGHLGAGFFPGIIFRDGGGADGIGDVADYGDSYGDGCDAAGQVVTLTVQ